MTFSACAMLPADGADLGAHVLRGSHFLVEAALDGSDGHSALQVFQECTYHAAADMGKAGWSSGHSAPQDCITTLRGLEVRQLTGQRKQPLCGTNALLGTIQRAGCQEGVCPLDRAEGELQKPTGQHDPVFFSLRLDLRGSANQLGVRVR
jgi:hypothetical protein